MKLSRSKIDLFIECPHCFYLDRVEEIKRPPGYPFTLNNAVDSLLKKEFDVHRVNGTSHPLQAHLNLVPSNNPNMDQWRNSLRGGVGYYHPNHDCTYFGGIDDLWVDDQNIHYVVDYKATARANPVMELPEWADGYKRQAEFYQWLLRKNGLQVSDTSYFVYCTGDSSAPDVKGKISFHMEVIAYEGSGDWIESTLDAVQEVLALTDSPEPSDNCTYCRYTSARGIR